jgi:hypothetical protein
LLVDRGAGPIAGPRSTSVGENAGKENHQRTDSMRSRQDFPFPRRGAASFNKKRNVDNLK